MSCHCDWCNNGYKDYRQGGVGIEDFDDEVKYRKGKSKKKSKACKKSKEGLPCDFSVYKITNQWYSKWSEKWHGMYAMACVRCGKHGKWGSFVSINKKD